jgi:hypothetical protein
MESYSAEAVKNLGWYFLVTRFALLLTLFYFQVCFLFLAAFRVPQGRYSQRLPTWPEQFPGQTLLWSSMPT